MSNDNVLQTCGTPSCHVSACRRACCPWLLFLYLIKRLQGAWYSIRVCKQSKHAHSGVLQLPVLLWAPPVCRSHTMGSFHLFAAAGTRTQQLPRPLLAATAICCFLGPISILLPGYFATSASAQKFGQATYSTLAQEAFLDPTVNGAYGALGALAGIWEGTVMYDPGNGTSMELGVQTGVFGNGTVYKVGGLRGVQPTGAVRALVTVQQAACERTLYVRATCRGNRRGHGRSCARVCVTKIRPNACMVYGGVVAATSTGNRGCVCANASKGTSGACKGSVGQHLSGIGRRGTQRPATCCIQCQRKPCGALLCTPLATASACSSSQARQADSRVVPRAGACSVVEPVVRPESCITVSAGAPYGSRVWLMDVPGHIRGRGHGRGVPARSRLAPWWHHIQGEHGAQGLAIR